MKKKEKAVLFACRAIIVLLGLIGIICLFALPPFGIVCLIVVGFCWYQTIRMRRTIE